ncbi:MAG: outer membrane protein transport protein [Burkholderiales bacterium]|nr:outer membrane protein transport protein [Burkholderiales bacterium]
MRNNVPGLHRLWGFLAAAVVACVALGTPQQASAMITENIGISAIGMAMGNAITADPPGLDSIHFNPAGLARVKGRWKSENFLVAQATPRASFTKPEGFSIGGFTDDPVAGTSTGPVRGTVYLPGIGANAKLPVLAGATLAFSFSEPDSPLTFASGVYLTQAAMFDRSQDPNDSARFAGTKVVMQRMVYASPSVGYKHSDTLSFGVGIPIAHQALAMTLEMRTPNKFLGITGKMQEAWCGSGNNPLDAFGFGLCGGGPEGRINPFKRALTMQLDATNPMDPTINVGMLWEPKPWFAFGAVYQGGSDTKLTGRYRVHVDPMMRKFVEGMYASLLGPIAGAMTGIPSSIREEQTGNMSTTLPFVQRVQFGIKLKPNKKFQLNLDTSWDEGAKIDKVKIQFDQQIDMLKALRMFGHPDPSTATVPMGGQSRWSWGAGLQFMPTDRLTFRLGYEDRKSTFPLDQFSLTAPLPDMKSKSFGIGYVTKKNVHLNFTYSYTHGTFNVPAEGSCNMNCSDFFNVVYNPYAGLDVAGDMTIKYIGLLVAKPF